MTIDRAKWKRLAIKLMILNAVLIIVGFVVIILDPWPAS